MAHKEITPLTFINSFQLITLFAGSPFLIAWLYQQSFNGSQILTWVMAIAYVISFGALTTVLADKLQKE